MEQGARPSQAVAGLKCGGGGGEVKMVWLCYQENKLGFEVKS